MISIFSNHVCVRLLALMLVASTATMAMQYEGNGDLKWQHRRKIDHQVVMAYGLVVVDNIEFTLNSDNGSALYDRNKIGKVVAALNKYRSALQAHNLGLSSRYLDDLREIQEETEIYVTYY